MEVNDLGDFFNRFNKNRFNRNEEDKNDITDFINNFIGRINKYEATGDDFKKIDELGKPDKVEKFDEGFLSFVKKTWNTENGEYVLVEAIGGVIDDNNFRGDTNLDEQLVEAIESENFEKAAVLRDQITDRDLMNGK